MMDDSPPDLFVTLHCSPPPELQEAAHLLDWEPPQTKEDGKYPEDTGASPSVRVNTPTEDLVEQAKSVRNGLSSLRDDHYNLLARIRDDYEIHQRTGTTEESCREDSLLNERIVNVTSSLERLEVGIDESTVLLALSDHFTRMETDRAILRLDMGRVMEENEWLREELSGTQIRLFEAEAELAELREEKRQREFMEELKNLSDSNIRPITPSKIPVGKFRVEVEKDINRAMNGYQANGGDSNQTSRSTSPAPRSRIPKGSWRNTTSAYSKVMEKQEKKAANDSNERNKRQYFKLNGYGSNSNLAVSGSSGGGGSSAGIAGSLSRSPVVSAGKIPTR